MAVTTLQSSPQTRATIVSTVLAGGTTVAWVIRQGIGFLWSGSALVEFGPQVANSISSGYLVMGNDGIAATQNILTSTYAGMGADDYVVSRVLIPTWRPLLLSQLVL